MRFPIWPKLSLSNDGYKKTHRRKLTEVKLARLGSLMRKEDTDVGAVFLAHFRLLHTSYLSFFCNPLFLSWGKTGV